MKHRKFRVGTKKWKKTGHRIKDWYLNTYGTSGKSMWERNGK